MALGSLCAAYAVNADRSRDWESLVAEVCRRTNESSFYTGVSVTEKELREAVAVDDIVSLYLFPYRKGMDAVGASRIAIKEHQGWRLVDFFVDRLGCSRVLAQVRDPRDNVASCKKLGRLYRAYHGSVPRAARIWTMDQRGILEAANRYGRRVVKICRYEDLVSAPRATLEEITAFLGLSWQEEMFDFYRKEMELSTRSPKYLANMWANLNRPVTAENVGRWRRALTTCEMLTVEYVVGPLLEEFGYDRATAEPFWRKWLCGLPYRLKEGSRFMLVTLILWLQWGVRTGRWRVAREVLLGKAVRGHRPYERFRDRFGYRL